MSGSFSEEFGWRGFALNPLLSKFGFTMGSIILGVLWGVWHLPLYFMPETWHGQMGFAFSGFWVFIISSVGMSCMMSLVYINTKNSILSAMLMHLFSNFTAQLLDRVSPNVETMQSILYFIIGIGICIYTAQRKKKAECTAI